MLRVWKVVSLIRKNEGSFSTNTFQQYLFFQTRLYEPWYMTLFKHDLFNKKNLKVATEKKSKRKNQIEDIISKAYEREYLDFDNSCKLVTTRKGREFLHPVYFIEACGREYRTWSVVATSVTTTAIVSILGTLLLS